MNLDEIRTHYPGLQNGTQLNTGGIGMPSLEVRAAVEANYHKLYDEYMSPVDWHVLTSQSAEEARQKLAAFVGAGENEVTLTTSTGDGYAAVLSGLSWEEGDEVLITNEEHYPIPYAAVMGLAEHEGVVVKEVEIDHDPAVMMHRLEALLTPCTKMICMSHVTTDSGLRVPAEQISRLARERGVWTLWDGCQAVGQVPINLRETGCDFYASNCYKWLLAPMGTGFLYVREEAQETLKSLLHPHDPQAGAGQYKIGHNADALYAGVTATIEFMESIGGVVAIQKEVSRKTAVLRDKLDVIPGVEIISSRRPDSETGIVCMVIDGEHGEKVSHALRHRFNIGQRSTHLTDPIGVRISVAFYTTEAELETLVAAVKVLAAEAGHG